MLRLGEQGSRGRRLLLLALPVLVASALPSARAGDEWIEREIWIPTPDPSVTLHADLLRGADRDWDEPQPVIVSVTPYNNHGGVIAYSPLRHARHQVSYQDDFLELSGALDQGYTLAIVDLPGFGGSTGCGDMFGPNEQAATLAAVEWIAAQPWSNGRVALFGISYDAATALMGVAGSPTGLEAVVAMAPIYDAYTHAYSQGVRNYRSVVQPAYYAGLAAQPGTANDQTRYNEAATDPPGCFPATQAGYLDDVPGSPYWQARDLRPGSAASRVPVFLLQGLQDTNTTPRGSVDYFASLPSPRSRAWFAQVDHGGGWFPGVGRGTFVAEAMDFLDEHLAGGPPIAHPRVVVEDSRGRFRGEDAFPPADAAALATELRPGSYVDGVAAPGRASTEAFTASERLPHAVWLSGEARVHVTVRTVAPRANLGVRVYEVHPDGTGVEVTRGAALIREPGVTTLDVTLMAQDWIFEPGRRIAVAFGPPTTEWYLSVASVSPIEVLGGAVTMPFLTEGRSTFLEGTESTALAQRQGVRSELRIVSSEIVPWSVPGPIDTGSR